MPRMIPSRPDSDGPASERKVFDRLAAVLPAHWTVLHGSTIVLTATAKAASTTYEIDFPALHPASALLALEVRGEACGARATTSDTRSTGRGEAHRIENPQKQVARNSYARGWPDILHRGFDGAADRQQIRSEHAVVRNASRGAARSLELPTCTNT